MKKSALLLLVLSFTILITSDAKAGERRHNKGHSDEYRAFKTIIHILDHSINDYSHNRHYKGHYNKHFKKVCYYGPHGSFCKYKPKRRYYYDDHKQKRKRHRKHHRRHLKHDYYDHHKHGRDCRHS